MEATGLNPESLVRFGIMLRTLKAATVTERLGIVVFGETFAQLCAQQKYDAAAPFAALWYELALTCFFWLCSAAPASAFRDGLTLPPYATICPQLSNLVSAFEAFAVPHGEGG